MKRLIYFFVTFLLTISLMTTFSCGGGGGGGSAAGPSAPSTAEESTPASTPVANEADQQLAPEAVLSSNAEILSFVFAKTENAAVPTDLAGVCSNNEVKVSYQEGTIVEDDKVNLLPTIIVSDGATITPDSGEPQDFSDTVTYTVTAQDGTEKDWTVNLLQLKGNQRTISYELDGGSCNAVLPTSFDIVTGTVVLPDENSIHKDNYIFSGWIDHDTGETTTGWGPREKNDNVLLSAYWLPAPCVADNRIYANGHNLIVESVNLATMVYFYDQQNNKIALTAINSQYPSDYSDYEIFAGHSGNPNTQADYPLAIDCTIEIKGGTLKNVYGCNAGEKTPAPGSESYVKISGDPTIGDKEYNGIWLRSFTDKVVTLNGSISSAGNDSITIIAAGSAHDGLVVAQSEGGNYASPEKFTMLNYSRSDTLGLKVKGSNVVVEGNVSLPVVPIWVDGADYFTLGEGHVNSKGTIFSVFVEDGWFTVPSAEIEGGEFDMAIVYRDDNKTEYLDGTGLTTETKLKYVQFTSPTGSIESETASEYLADIHFYIKSNMSQITVNINLQTAPLDLLNVYTYFNGSFYEIVENVVDGKDTPITWTDAYNGAKKRSFDGLPGYLLTITSDVENKFVYDRLLKKNPKYANVEPKLAQSWLGASRDTNKNGYDAATWSSDSKKNDWYWVCGPEAGKKFYSGKTWDKGTGHRADGMYASWDNKDERALNGLDTSQWTEPNGPSEYYAQYSGQYVWNDLDNAGGKKKPTAYIVEYSVYGSYAPEHKVLKATKKYTRKTLAK